MTTDAERKLAAHQALYAAQPDIDDAPAEIRPASLVFLDAALAKETWRWEPSPTAYASWAEYNEAVRIFRQGPAARR